MTTSAARMRCWIGPTIPTFGFHPFLLGAGSAALVLAPWIVALFWALVLSVAARILSLLLPDQFWLLHPTAAGWIAACGGFTVVYWPIPARPCFAPRRPVGRERSP